MKVEVQLFANLRDCLPADSKRGKAEVELEDGATLRDLFVLLDLDRCITGNESFFDLLDAWQISHNGEFTHDLSRRLEDGDVVVVFPHMAGG